MPDFTDFSTNALAANRGFLYGDAVFETMKAVNGRILFFEDHYFRLMAAMRIVRMEIPMHFTMEFLEATLLQAIEKEGLTAAARIRITVFRDSDGFYQPDSNQIGYEIKVSSIGSGKYENADGPYEIELFKDFYITRHLLSTIKTTNKLLNVTASIFANENGYENCLLLNEAKNVVGAVNGNLFMRMGKQVFTPPVSEGCLNGIMRKQILSILRTMPDYEVLEQPISPFELQKSDELFLTNVIFGVQPISKYRKKEFEKSLAPELISKLNALADLN